MLLHKIFCILLALESIRGMGLPKRFHNRFERLKKKINKLIKGKEGNELFLDIVELEYPKVNETLRRMYRQQWDEYYDCLKNQIQDAGAEKTTYPTVLSVLVGTSVVLKCKLCVSPGELQMSDSIEWRYNSSTDPKVTNVPMEPSEHVLVTPDERDLHFYSVQSEGGIYWCQLGDTVSAPYYLQADEATDSTRSVQPESSTGTRNHPAPPENLDEYGLRVFTSWTPWSLCSTCGKVGQRTRYGYCTISISENGLNPYNAIEGATLGTNGKTNAVTKIEESTVVSENGKRSIRLVRRQVATETSSETITNAFEESTIGDIEDEGNEKKDKKSPRELKNLARIILPIFRNKLPCRSMQTPKEFMKIEQIGERKTEIMTGLCKMKCEKEVIFEIRDKSGNVLESANNSAGIFSMVQGLPEPRPSVERITIYRKHGKSVTLVCPGNLNADVPMVWQIGTRALVPSAIEEETDERISIDSRRRIFIKKVRFGDSKMYSCWQRGELAGTIRLEVTDEVELKVDHRVFMIGAIVIVLVVLNVFWRAFKGRKRLTAYRARNP